MSFSSSTPSMRGLNCGDAAAILSASETTYPESTDSKAASTDLPPYLSQRSSSSNLSGAESVLITPASSKGCLRMAPSVTIASSPPVRASMDSYLSKRPLTQLTEHPEERDSTFLELVAQNSPDHFDTFPNFSQHSHTDFCEREDQLVDYDWAENSPQEFANPDLSVSKRRRSEKSTPSMLSTKFANRFPSISGKFRSRSENRSSSLTEGFSMYDSLHARSRASSMRSATTRESSLDIIDVRDIAAISTARTSHILGESVHPAEMPEAVIPEEEVDEGQHKIEHPGISRTPLLPPMLAIRADVEENFQSPLQSPKVAETPTTTSPSHYEIPSPSCISSPPLSARPSMASFQHCPATAPSQILSITLVESKETFDEWSISLGHENFTIVPEPYLPAEPTFESCRVLKMDWELAEREFGRHLARTKANYSATSTIVQLTEQKWSAINSLWMSYHAQALQSATKKVERDMKVGHGCTGNNQLVLSQQTSLHEPVPKTQIPSHLVGGKFPSFGDAGIVGPMEVIEPISSSLKGTKGRKRSFWKVFQDLIPDGLISSKA